MDELVASVGTVVFDLERDLDEQTGALPLPFPGMDKSGSATCVFHLRGFCQRAAMCPFRHIKPDRTIVCKHWLRGLCKKGDSCEFLHEYDMSKMPECYFYSKFRACSNKECPFLHIDPESKIKDCPWYDRGFCRHGPNCRHRHTRRVACMNYLCGFCPDGPSCKFVHMRFDIPQLGGPPGTSGASTSVTITSSMMPSNGFPSSSDAPESAVVSSTSGGPPTTRQGPLLTVNSNIPSGGGLNENRGYNDRSKPKGMVICHYCNEPGHKIYVCTAIPPDQRDEVIQKFLAEQKANYENRNRQRYGGGNQEGGDRENYQPYNRYHPNNNHHNRHQNMENGGENGGDSNSYGSSISVVSGGAGMKEPLLSIPGGGGMSGGPGGPSGGGGGGGGPGGRRPLDQVTCFKCGEKGHYANKCPKGYLAFLSPALNNLKRSEPDS